MAGHDSHFTALLIGCLVSVGLFVVNLCQVIFYLWKYTNDPWAQKCFVFFICMLECAHCALAGRTAYTAHIDDEAAQMRRLLVISGLLSVAITALVQWYFAHRLYKLSEHPVLPVLCAILSSIRFVFYLAATINRLINQHQSQPWIRCLFVTGIISISVDVLLAAGLSVNLWKRRSSELERNQISVGPRIVDQIFIIAIQADVFTCIVTTVTLVVYNCSDSFAWMAMSFVSCRLFAISFLFSLLKGKGLERERKFSLPEVRLDSLPNSSPMNYQSFADLSLNSIASPSRSSPA